MGVWGEGIATAAARARAVGRGMAYAAVWAVSTVAEITAMSGPAHALPISRLVMPGPLIEGHAELEDKCMKCHEPFKRELQTGLCLDCHKEVAEDFGTGAGFHGRIDPGKQPVCSRCHTDHEGRDADIVLLDLDILDHERTDFPLVGAHRSLACEHCHDPDLSHRQAPSRCIGCHRDDDAHRGVMGENCAQCHDPATWSQAEFDHGITDFALAGAHANVLCNQCHAESRYEHTPTECVSCHLIDDVHTGSNGRECERCHAPTEWKKVSFEHNRDTEFELVGRHRQARCEGCHLSNVFEADLDAACIACHRADDRHRGRNGTECESCHRPENWDEVAFDHSADTDFVLRGKHAGVGCTSCHQGDLRGERLSTDCYACHRTDDAHDGRQGEACAECHAEDGWGRDVFFDHDITRFPLAGLHALAPCEACHVSTVYTGTATACAACHGDDDHHADALGVDCAHCHNPNAWDAWLFDHDKDTGFVLDGAHEGLACAACHTRPAPLQVEQSSECYSCHRLDDAHRGDFGHLCGSCHVTSSFKELRLP